MLNCLNSSSRPLFPLGRIVATPGALDAMEKLDIAAWTLLSRHRQGDWGDLSPEDRVENELAVRKGFRVLSSYPIGSDVRIWIITEADRSVTTLLLPEEY